MKEKNVVLKVCNLKKSYKHLLAVDNISLEVKKGEIFGLLGPNGAGKSTTIECILGTKKMDEGTVELLGTNPTQSRKQLFSKVGVQFQESNYQDKIKVKEVCQVTESLYPKTLDYRQLLKEFSLEGKENTLVEDLSGGERQKLSVLLSFLHKPQMVFLDELTTGLDPKSRRNIWQYIEYLKKQGVTIFLTSHYMDEVEYLCDRVCILKKGTIAISGTPKEIMIESQQKSFEDAYLYFTDEEVINDEIV